MNLKKIISNPFFFSLQTSFTYLPLPLISLIIYMGLSSSSLFYENTLSLKMWHLSFFGWYDLLLGSSIIFSIISGSLKIHSKSLFFLLALALAVILSFSNTFEIAAGYIRQDERLQCFLDSLVCFVRFSLTFCLAEGIVYKLGEKRMEDFSICLYMVLAISSLFVASLTFGQNNRMYAAGMTSASFGQISSVIWFIAYIRNYKLIQLISFVFILLTFSRTSLVVTLLIFFMYARKINFINQIKSYVFIAFTTLAFLYIIINFGGEDFARVIADRYDSEQISNLNSRTMIWEHAVFLIRNGQIPLFGIGFNCSPFFIIKTGLKFQLNMESFDYPVHFHSILFEYIIELGILGLFIFFYLIKRIWQTFLSDCHPSFFIFSFFLITQSLDFTFYQPKEVIVWSIMLGIAEGQWKCKHNLSIYRVGEGIRTTSLIRRYHLTESCKKM